MFDPTATQRAANVCWTPTGGIVRKVKRWKMPAINSNRVLVTFDKSAANFVLDLVMKATDKRVCDFCSRRLTANNFAGAYKADDNRIKLFCQNFVCLMEATS
jgi:hypothetical protein